MVLLASSPAADQAATEALLYSKQPGRKKVPGQGFKAETDDGRWVDYSKEANAILKPAYEAGLPSLRFMVKGLMYKFDFESMEQKCLSNLETRRMRPPHNTQRPRCAQRRSFMSLENWRHAMSSERDQKLTDAFTRSRPAYVVRAPAGTAGTSIKIPHPKKLGKAIRVKVPAQASAGQPIFVPVPRRGVKSKASTAMAGGAAGACTTLGAVAFVQSSGGALSGAAAASGTIVAAAPVLLGGACAVGALAAGAAGLHYASKRPGRVAVAGVLTLGALAAADHIGDVGVTSAIGDAVEAAGAGFDSAADAYHEVVELGEDLAEAVDDVGDEMQLALDFIESLFD